MAKKLSKYNKDDNLPKIDMREAATLAGFSLDLRKNTTHANCPFCGGKKKFYISLSMPNNPLGYAHCMKCGENLSPIGMFAYSQGISDMKEAANVWYKMQRGAAGSEGKKKMQKVREIPKVDIKSIDVEPASLEVRDRTYKEMLKLLALFPEHKENLLNRGLTESAINENGYRSMPSSEKNSTLIIQTLLQKGCVLLGVPGFYQSDDKKWHMSLFGPGILIPQRNGFGQIQSLQIRRDTDAKAKRYISFSSRDMLNGAPAYAHCHFRLGRKGLRDVIITEGPLKADVISCLTGYSVIAVPGVNSLAFLPQALYDLKAKGMKKVTIAYDMDIRTNEAVQKAQVKLTQLLERAGIYYSILKWDETFKGLDDWAVEQIRRNNS